MDKKTVEHIANLARLSVTEEELEIYSQQLSKVLDYFKEIEAIDTKGVEPLYTAAPIAPRSRTDERVSGPGADAILKNAPDRAGNLFRVPNVV